MMSHLMYDLLMCMSCNERAGMQRALSHVTNGLMRTLFSDDGLCERETRDVTKRLHECIDTARMIAEFRPHNKQPMVTDSKPVRTKTVV